MTLKFYIKSSLVYDGIMESLYCEYNKNKDKDFSVHFKIFPADSRLAKHEKRKILQHHKLCISNRLFPLNIPFTHYYFPVSNFIPNFKYSNCSEHNKIPFK